MEKECTTAINSQGGACRKCQISCYRAGWSRERAKRDNLKLVEAKRKLMKHDNGLIKANRFKKSSGESLDAGAASGIAANVGRMTIKFYWHKDWLWSLKKCDGFRIRYIDINIGRIEFVVFGVI